MDVRDEIKSRLPIEQLVAQYCQLQKKGRNFVCVCPFHNDTRPSFVVSPDKGIGWCFACNTGGDIFSFVQKIENVDFPAALKILADKAGIALPEAKPAAIVKQEKDEKQRVKSVLEEAATFFELQLSAHPQATAYLQSRGMPQEILKRFRVGYAPDSFSQTYEHLLKAGYSRSDILLAGLAVQRDLADQHVYDRFRHRIMFPILDVQGAVIAFGGRTLKDDDAKYINSPDNPLYHKSSILFGLSHAKEAMRTSHTVLVVEGYFDLLASHLAGVQNVVAVCGTALTEQHVKLIKRYCETAILCLDQDQAGKQAALRAFELLAKEHVIVQSLQIPAKDPDELVQKDPAMLQRLVAEYPVPYIHAVVDQLSELSDLHQPTGRRMIADTLFPLLASVPSSIELRAYIEGAARSLKLRESELMSDFQSWRSASRTVTKPKKEQPPDRSAPYDRWQLCLGIALLYPSLRPSLENLIPGDDEQWNALRSAVIAASVDSSAEYILDSIEIDETFREQLKVLVLYCEENFAAWSDSMAGREMAKLYQGANRDSILRKQTAIIIKMREAQHAGNLEEEAILLNQYQQVIKLAKMAG